MCDACVDARLVLLSAADAPADDADQLVPVRVVPLQNERSARVALWYTDVMVSGTKGEGSRRKLSGDMMVVLLERFDISIVT